MDHIPKIHQQSSLGHADSSDVTKEILEKAVAKILDAKPAKIFLEEAVLRVNGVAAAKRILEETAHQILKEQISKRILKDATSRIMRDEVGNIISKERRVNNEQDLTRTMDEGLPILKENQVRMLSKDMAQIDCISFPTSSKTAFESEQPSKFQCIQPSAEVTLQGHPSFSAAEKRQVTKSLQGRIKSMEDVFDEEAKAIDPEAEVPAVLEERLMEERRLTVHEYIPVACSQAKEITETFLNHWIPNELTIQNIKEIGNIYEWVISEVLKDYRGVIDPSAFQEFAEKVAEETKWLQICVEKVRGAVETFNAGVKKKFEFEEGFIADVLNEMLEAEVKKVNDFVGRDDDGYRLGFVSSACVKLKQLHLKDNELIMSLSRNLAENLALQAKNFYHNEMKVFLQKQVYTQTELKQLNTNLIGTCVENFEKKFVQTKPEKETMSKTIQDLKTELGEAFQVYKDANSWKLKIQSEINKVIMSLKAKYTQKMEAFLSSTNQSGLNVGALGREHRKVSGEVQTLLKIEIRGKLGEMDDQTKIASDYARILEQELSKVFSAHKAAKEEGITNKPEELKRDAEVKKMKPEAFDWHQEQDVETQRLSGVSSQRPSTSTSTIATTNTKQDEKMRASEKPNTEPENMKKLPLLVFQLSMKRVRMGMMVDGQPTILLNEFKEPFTPAVVGLTLEGTLIYGSEALSEGKSSKVLSTTGGGVWLIAQHFIREDNNVPVKTIQINGEMCEITVEFLLGFLLRQLKSTVEKERSGTFSTTLITVPFWLTSAQRLQVKDAGRVAGFSKVYLVNEPSVAAYACAYSESRQHSVNNIIVLSENSDYVDASVYSYDGHRKKIQMIAHCGDYGLESKKHGVWHYVTKIQKDIALNLLNLNSGSDSKEVKDQIKKNVSRACSTAIGDSQKSKRQPMHGTSGAMETLVCFESSEWRDVLETVGRTHVRLICNMKPDEVVLTGAVLLGQNPQIIGESIRDMLAFEVLTSSLPAFRKLAIDKGDLPVSKAKRTSPLPRGHGEAHFYQRAMGFQIPVGSLKIDSVKANDDVTVHLQITNEAIVSLQGISLETAQRKTKSMSSSTYCEYLHEEQYTWKTPNLTEGRVEELISFLERLSPPQESELSKAQTILKEKCEEMQDSISSGKFKFKTDLGKGYAEKQIQEALDFANHPNTTMDGVEKQMEKIIKLHAKFAF